jgi:putative ABC transport system ATP-binding protein
MEAGFLKFVWKYSKREQFFILALTLLSFPLVYFSLDIPKTIVNQAINGRDFPKTILGFEFEQDDRLGCLDGSPNNIFLN